MVFKKFERIKTLDAIKMGSKSIVVKTKLDKLPAVGRV